VALGVARLLGSILLPSTLRYTYQRSLSTPFLAPPHIHHSPCLEAFLAAVMVRVMQSARPKSGRTVKKTSKVLSAEKRKQTESKIGKEVRR